MAQWLVNLALTGFDVDGFHDRLLIARVPKGIVSYIVHVRLGSPPLTMDALETAHQPRAAKSQRPEDMSARKEIARRR